MGWLPQSKYDESRLAVEALTVEQRNSITWEEANKFVMPDTIELARWSGLKKRNLTPWEALAMLKGIKP